MLLKVPTWRLQKLAFTDSSANRCVLLEQPLFIDGDSTVFTHKPLCITCTTLSRFTMKFLIVKFLLAVIVLKIKALPTGEISGSAHVDVGLAGNFNKQINISSIVASKIAAVNIIPERPKGRERAVLEHPTWINQKDSVYDYAQQAVANFFHPKPIIDTIEEHEKYGNTGDKFRPIGNAIVEGYEGFSNFLNAAADFYCLDFFILAFKN
ncbi:hypothetical protein ILUMI_11841 [Ignelater luminosus]|uniref:Uncharacterized protein n=1 Tax=Ignelater luminosus TaxID=2038154 RepID=A0A8K0D0P9_IGNLU|nr:hypothetical protein ILUMI_11841 [Ignelater luminosus]